MLNYQREHVGQKDDRRPASGKVRPPGQSVPTGAGRPLVSAKRRCQHDRNAPRQNFSVINCEHAAEPPPEVIQFDSLGAILHSASAVFLPSVPVAARSWRTLPAMEPECQRR